MCARSFQGEQAHFCIKYILFFRRGDITLTAVLIIILYNPATLKTIKPFKAVYVDLEQNV